MTSQDLRIDARDWSLLAVLTFVAEGYEILDDRCAHHRRGERPPIRFEREEDHIASVERLAKIELDPVGRRIERRAYV